MTRKGTDAGTDAGTEPGADGGTAAATVSWRVRQAGEGRKWEAVLIAPGVSSSRPKFRWTDRALQAAAPLFEGADIMAFELPNGWHDHLPEGADAWKSRLVMNKAGNVRNVRWEGGAGIVGDIEFGPRYAWVPETLADRPDSLGLSIDARVMASGEEPYTVDEIRSVSSVDIVTKPAAGGKFRRAVAGEGEIDVTKEKIIEMVKAGRPDLLEGVDVEMLDEAGLEKIAKMAMTPPAAATETRTGTDGQGRGTEGGGEGRTAVGDGNGPGEGANVEKRAAQGVTAEDLAKAMEQVERRAACAVELDRAVRDLPEETADRIRTRFGGQVFEAAELQAAVKGELDYLAKMASPKIDIPDQVRVEGGATTLDKLQAATDRLFGLGKAELEDLGNVRTTQGQPLFDLRGTIAAQDARALTGIRELYIACTGDSELTGFYQPAKMSRELRAAQADFSTSVLDLLLANTMNRRMVRDYREANYHEGRIISTRKSVKDFRAQEAVVVGYLTDLDAVAKGGDYTEFDAITDEKASYSVGKKGNILPLYWEDIVNDDVSYVDRMVTRAARAARRTHAKAVWAPFISNANCSDGTAWFTVGHGNLGSTALSFATALAAYKALAGMTELDSGEKIGWLDDPSVKPCLIYPPDLMETGETIVMDPEYYSTNDLTTKKRNPLKGKIDGIQLSLLADANDWGMLMPPSAVDMVEMGYLNGRQEPEVFLANVPTQGAVFTSDVIKYKIRFVFGGALTDYRGGYKAVVA